ncbi:hypothetical protein ACQ9AR_33410 [Streptomyces lividans]|uniref:PQC542.9c n=1 Tax=Streptomyces lividans TaxID=1916 RepID=Q204A1_STRLI|nr:MULTISPECIES: hypothetical protein [Streptomyces]ABD72313.1 pQC542.9c [Streptomyces lividans]KKD10998.1 hypothetical protein TR66_33355 [Streptomyces sp. WM6391]
MIEKIRARRRHARLMKVATSLVREATVISSEHAGRVTTAQIACLAFARYEMRIDDTEAADYLAAALVARGYSTDHRPAPAV